MGNDHVRVRAALGRHARELMPLQDAHGPREEVSGLPVIFRMPSVLIFMLCSYPQLVGTRVCLGIAEAGLFPGVVY